MDRWLVVALAVPLLAVALIISIRQSGGPGVEPTPVKIASISQSANDVPVYTRFEVSLQVEATYTNPFDPEQLDIVATFRSESGASHPVPAFLYQDYERSYAGREVLRPIGRPLWKVRFTPTEVGEYSFEVVARNPKYSDNRSGSFRAVPSNETGFVKVHEGDRRYFQLDDGRPIFFVGINLGWYTGSNGTYDYERWFSKMRENGINLARLWMASWSFGIEWNQLGFYDLERAWRLDWVLDEAEKNDIYIMLCLINHGQFSATVNPQWNDNPYNSRLGGPLNSPSEFFVNQRATQLFLQRTQYIVARWGYSTHLMAWELWNEVDLTDGYQRASVRNWHKSVGEWLRRTDPYGHLISTSFSNPNADDEMWGLEQIDFSQVHIYSSRDLAHDLSTYVRDLVNRHNKPAIVGEFSADWRGPPTEIDPAGLNVHNGIWSTALSGSGVTAMSWWWDNYIEPLDLFNEFRPLSQFTRELVFPPVRLRDWRVNVTAEIPLYSISLGNETAVVAWIKDAENTWWNVRNGYEPPRVRDLRVSVYGLAEGRYRIIWYDTYTGATIQIQEVTAENGAIEVSGPEFSRDVALAITLAYNG